MAQMISVETYHDLGVKGMIPEKTELLYGLIYAKIPVPPFHSFLVRRLFATLERIEIPGSFVWMQQPLTFEDSEPEPDIAIVPGRNEDYRSSHPKRAECVIEVCVSSVEYDRYKLRAYASAGVKECWLVLADAKQVEVHFNPVNGVYSAQQSFGSEERVQSQVIPALQIDLRELFG
jgi:Uma2 family endonuclease